MDPAEDVQRAVIAALRASAPLMAVVTGVFDQAPDEQAFPYIEIQEIDGTDASTKTKDALDMRITFDIWSAKRGNLETWQIMGLIRDVLQRQRLALTDHEMITPFLEDFRTAFSDEDPRYRHGVQRFMFQVRES